MTTVEENHFSFDKDWTHFKMALDKIFVRSAKEILKTGLARSAPNGRTKSRMRPKKLWTDWGGLQSSRINSSRSRTVHLKWMVRMSVVNNIGAERTMFKLTQELLKKPPEEWRKKWVILFHRKGTRDDLDNYRGACLLPLASSIIVRILATRLRPRPLSHRMPSINSMQLQERTINGRRDPGGADVWWRNLEVCK